ncbi:hypothetical protein NP233_g3416 [Leucocoprinus birnbaumii]|uniref:G domain-containing protein n=1 Tax=Leucocoprinus birnbaumii TaxID=56174 RepID=A0AAD5YYC5_9AGAR|nr:hypothetical protein NP233_g3416 [Leucocoprinus birnbaumii]
MAAKPEKPRYQVQDIRNATKGVRPDDIIVAFMGETGSGKSHFIDLLTGQKGRRAQNSANSVTQNIEATRILPDDGKSGNTRFTIQEDVLRTLQGRSIVLVDTPGFDDSTRSDYQILCLINDWLKETYQREVKLSGLVYLHRITHNRMAGTPHKNLRMFAKLCGDIAMTQVILVTTFWERGDARTAGQGRVKELMDIYWKPLLDRGSSVDALKTATPAEAWRIITALIGKRVKESERVLLQEEIVDKKIALNETEAGQALYSNYQKQLAARKKNLAKLRKDLEVSKDKDLKSRLEAEIKVAEQEFNKTFQESNALKRSLIERIISLLSGRKTQARAVNVADATN